MSAVSQLDLNLTKRWYGTTTNTTGTPLIEHVLSAVQFLEKALSQSDLSPEKQLTLIRATLGHDLLEDTIVTPTEIRSAWGDETLGLISELTNAKGDSDFTQYLETLSKASEEVRLIKFADIAANLQNTLDKFADIDPAWIREFWLPLLQRYETQLLSGKFTLYPLVAGKLTKTIKQKLRHLRKKLKGEQ